MPNKSSAENIDKSAERLFPIGTEADIIRVYLKEAKSFDFLTPDQEKELARHINGSDSPEKQKLINSNLRLVISIARRYISKGLSFADLVQEGNIGLLKAVEKFDPDRGTKFATYATWWIRQSILIAISNQSRTIRTPIYIINKHYQINCTVRKFYHEFGRDPSVDEIAEITSIPPAEVNDILESLKTTISLDSPIAPDKEDGLYNLIKDDKILSPDDLINDKKNLRFINRTFKCLTTREEKIVRMRYGLPPESKQTLDEIGEYFDLTRERIRQLQLRAEKKIKYYLREQGILEFDS